MTNRPAYQIPPFSTASDPAPPREETMARFMAGASRVADLRRSDNYTVADRLEERAEDRADVPFILFEDARITFEEMNRRANRIGRAVLELGIERGDTVALLMENRPDYLAVWLGLAKFGVTAALINTSASGSVLAHALDQVGSKAIICDVALYPPTLPLDHRNRPYRVLVLPEAGQSCPERAEDLRERVNAVSDDNPDKSRRAGLTLADPHYLIFTSGTTGQPKAAIISNLRFIVSGEMMGGLIGADEGDVLYCFLPLYHGAGGMVLPSLSLAFGIPMVLRRKFSVSQFWSDVERHKITALYYIGEIVRFLLTPEESPGEADNTLRAIMGAGLRPDVWSEFVRRFNVPLVVEGLGSTEANYGITNVDNRIGSVGRIPYREHSNVRVLKYDIDADEHVCDTQGRPIEAKAGEVGELIAEVHQHNLPSGMFEGYTSSEATESKLMRDVFKQGDVYFRSGDLVRFDKDDFFYFVDRAGDTFRWNSENVSTLEVETILTAAPGVASVNVYGVKVPGCEGRAGMAAIVPADTLDPSDLYEYATRNLARYAVPRFLRIQRATEMTTTYKLRKVGLKKAGYDPGRCGDDALWIIDDDAQTYVPLDGSALTRLRLPSFEPEA